MKKYADGGVGPGRKKANYPGSTLKSRISDKLYTPKSCGGLGFTKREPREPQQVHMGDSLSGNSGSKRTMDRSRIVTPKELERKREKEARQNKRQERRSMTREERKVAEQKAKDQRYANPRFL